MKIGKKISKQTVLEFQCECDDSQNPCKAAEQIVVLHDNPNERILFDEVPEAKQVDFDPEKRGENPEEIPREPFGLSDFGRLLLVLQLFQRNELIVNDCLLRTLGDMKWINVRNYMR